MWHEEESLRTVVILNPIEFLVTPLTTIICKFVSEGDADPTMHERPIHKKAQRLMARKFVDLTDSGRLAHSLLVLLLSEYEANFDVLVSLMVKFGFLVEIKPKTKKQGEVVVGLGDGTQETHFIVPALLPKKQQQQKPLQTNLYPVQTKFYFGLTLDPDVSSSFSVAFADNLQKTCMCLIISSLLLLF